VFNTTVGQEKKADVEQPISLRSSFFQNKLKKIELKS